MAAFKYQSLKYTIAKVFRDLRLEDPNYELDMIEWAGEALDFIGAGSQFVTVVGNLEVDSYKAQLPVGLVKINQIAYENDGRHQIIRYNGKSFPDAYHQEGSPNIFAKTAESYQINGDYLLFSQETATLKISYSAIATDEQGYPLVPDNQYYRQAIFWYIYRQLIMLGHVTPTGIDYQFADQKWMFYCSGARNKANYPSLSEYKQFASSWASLLPNINAYDEGFDNATTPQVQLDVINASNLVTRPLTVEIPEE